MESLECQALQCAIGTGNYGWNCGGSGEGLNLLWVKTYHHY